ncbi:M16 family metallopeptidase [Novosphingobium mangrovi (ex Huang et al. 2023)]|uniref:Insulinase family protein n=1 Tax=Novosphingobium mangrovi (ex Huang et al. 2023) TaxID=2976432 RepID=A0ABT2I4D2_9SPHN|nr:M16 family metallopeptidase [Novosphingobium mangrovi (ex Huang et al. 2023)]MCT2399640.1 insulinase family protein [Novosphingobium mangrovi (ex Huang et al. 2023)]
MKTFPRAACSLACLLLLAQVPALPVLAQQAEVPATLLADTQDPWLYRNSDIPHDKAWHFGEMSNGLRYAVRKNGVPPGQVSIRIRVDAGSLYETDSERGYAHLLEHMLFRQSKYLAEGTAIAAFQRLGATFGSDTNAQTTTTETVFKLDLPNATPGSLDETFKLLSGMVTAPTLSASNLKKDLPIVLAEMRERGGAAKRLQDAMQQVFYAGQPLSEREPIGTVETLTATTPKSVRAFYSRWYRPDNVTVIVAGDADPAMLESYVHKWFGDWSASGPLAPVPSFGDPVAPRGVDPKNPVGETRVLVEPDLPPSLMYAILRPWRQVNDTIVYNQGLMTDSIAQAIINRRLESKARAGGSFLSASVNQNDVARSADATFVSVTPLGDDWKAALHDVRAVIADALTRPPTQEEIDREVAELDVAFQVPVEQQRILPGSKLADDLVNALDIRETVAAPDDVLNIFRESKPLFTPAKVLEHTRKLFSGTVTRALFTVQKPGEVTDKALQQALLEPVRPDQSIRMAAEAAPVSFDKLPAIGTAAEPIADQPTGLLDIEQLTFANGVKVMLWPVTEEPGRVMVKVRFGGGYRSIDPRDAPYIALGQYALVGSGVATLGQEDLDRIATGRKMGFDFDVHDATFELSAETRPQDLADQLYLFAAKLDLPKWDKNPFLRAKAAAKIQYDTYATSPQGVLNRDLQFYQRGQDPRFATPTPTEIEATTPEGFKRVWSKALSQGPVEVQIFGDFDKVKAIAALEKTFGALKPRTPAPSTADVTEVQVPRPSEKAIVLHHHGDPDQAAAVISWPTGGGSLGIRESRQLEILTQLFSNRLLDAMREKLGVSYAPYVFSTWPVDLQAGGSITAMAQLDPKSVPVFFQVADEIAQDLIANPPTADELERVTEPLRQQVTRAASSTSFFMSQLEGATSDPSRLGSVRTVLSDYTVTTPQTMQQLAARYLGEGSSWRLEVVPEKDKTSVATR